MNCSEFIERMRQETAPVILLEGSRDVPEAHRRRLIDLGSRLARELPHAMFRSGNADGADSLFAQGVNRVDPARMQLVTPTESHRKKNRYPDSPVFALSRITPDVEERLAEFTIKASEANLGIIQKRKLVPALRAKAGYLLRDTLKVLGDSQNCLVPATAAIFYTKPDPMSGGTGHTIRVCHQQGIPVYLQSSWWKWVEDDHSV